MQGIVKKALTKRFTRWEKFETLMHASTPSTSEEVWGLWRHSLVSSVHGGHNIQL